MCCILQQERAQQLRVVRERFPQVSTVKLCPLFQVGAVVLEEDDNFVYVAPNHLQSVLYQALRRRGPSVGDCLHVNQDSVLVNFEKGNNLASNSGMTWG